MKIHRPTNSCDKGSHNYKQNYLKLRNVHHSSRNKAICERRFNSWKRKGSRHHRRYRLRNREINNSRKDSMRWWAGFRMRSCLLWARRSNRTSSRHCPWSMRSTWKPTSNPNPNAWARKTSNPYVRSTGSTKTNPRDKSCPNGSPSNKTWTSNTK